MVARVAVLVLLVSACSSSREGRGRELVADEFRYVRGDIACLMTSIPGVREGYRPCLRIGPTHVGDDFADTEAHMGRPYAIEPVDEGRGRAHIYVFEEQPGTRAFVSFWEHDGRVMAIQLTGRAGAGSLDFAGLRLGDAQSKLVDTLGPPASVEHTPGRELWSYRPFPFAMELRQGRVYSIRIWSPDHEPCPCGEPRCCGGVGAKVR